MLISGDLPESAAAHGLIIERDTDTGAVMSPVKSGQKFSGVTWISYKVTRAAAIETRPTAGSLCLFLAAIKYESDLVSPH